MIPQIKLETHGCIECDKATKVPMIQPYEGKEEPTGMTVNYMDEDQDTHIIGVLCKECAFKLCDEGVVSIGYAGFPHSWDACFSDKKPHGFPFEKKNKIQCLCDKCTERKANGW